MTSVTCSGALVAAVALAAGALLALPADAGQPSNPVSGLVGGLAGQSDDSQSPRAERARFGRTSAADGRLRSGCRNYAYRYAVTAPTNDWTLETFLDDPAGETLSSGAFLAESDARRGPAVFRFCRYSTQPGRFTIRAKVTWYDGSQEHRSWFQPSHFRLTRPR